MSAAIAHEAATTGCHEIGEPARPRPRARRRRRRDRECPEIAGFLRRMSRALVARAADGDLEALSALQTTRRDIDVALGQAARALNACGYSWADIGREIGTTKQNAIKRFAAKGDTPS